MSEDGIFPVHIAEGGIGRERAKFLQRGSYDSGVHTHVKFGGG